MRDLTDLARRGDADALAELWRRHHHRVVRYLRGRSAAGAEDLASQVWVDVARTIGRFEGDDEDFPKWLFTIARRRYVDAVRRSVARPEQPSGDLSGPRAVSNDVASSAEHQHDEQASLDRALALVRRLPEPMAEVVLLRVVADLSVTEVAEITGKSEGNVRVLAHRGLDRLRQLVEASSESATHRPEKSVTDWAPPTIKEVT